jgi:glycerate 2-kinase
MDQRKMALGIFKAGVESVLPGNLINNHISLNDNILSLKDVNYDLSVYAHIYLVGFGKASAGMAGAMEAVLGDRITEGHIITKYGHAVPMRNITVTEAGHPVPDENGMAGTWKILEIIKKAKLNDLVIVLISGGGSALLTDLPEGINLEELASLNKLLINSGADISEINSVRKHLSQLKGGQLARLAFPASVLSLLLSDVTGDLPDVIASGPTVPDPSTFGDAIRVLEKYHIESLVPSSVREYLRKGESGFLPETVKETDSCFLRTRNVILGNNKTALGQSKSKAEEFGYDAVIVSNIIGGDVADVARMIFSETTASAKGNHGSKIALLFGGEPTVQHAGNGMGGRNQHLALLMAQKLTGITGITFLSAGTDGTDGPTDAAGAMCDGMTIQNAAEAGINAEEMAQNFDSYHFFKSTGGLIQTGPTYTNVMDLMIILINS